MPIPPDVLTARIPELTYHTDPLSLTDRVPVWIEAINKTRQVTLQDLRTLIETGGNTPLEPVYNGGQIIHDVTAAEAGGTIISIPEIAGKQFSLTRDGFPLMPDTEFSILAGGGMQLQVPGDELVEGQRFVFDLFELQGGNPSVPAGSSGSFLKGKVVVTTNLVMNVANHVGKILQIRANVTPVEVTLPPVEDVPANSIIIAETAITNLFQSKIKTAGGQFIYLNNAGVNAIYLGVGESLWLYRDVDGYYVINDFGKIIQEVGQIQAAYKVGLNEVLADGSILSRATYPRLWEWVQGLGASLVSDTTWLTASVTVGTRTVERPYRGCFSTGNGSTTFRVPDLMNVALRGVKSVSGSDTERYLNKPGGFQRNELESHSHPLPIDIGGVQNRPSLMDSANSDEGLSDTNRSGNFGGSETRMDNVGVLWTIKV